MHTKSISMKKVPSLLAIALGSASVSAEPMAYKTDSGIEFIPVLGVFYEGNDNINKADSGENIESVNIWGVEPALLAKIERNQYRANLLYKLSAGFSSDEQNNYDDHTFQFTNFFEFNRRNRLVVDYQFRAQHEEKGEGFSEGQGTLLNDPIEFHRNDLKTNYVFGSEGSKGRLEFGLGYRDTTYQNYRNGLPGKPQSKTKYNDFRSPNAHLEFYLRATPRTYWLVGTQQTTTDYRSDNPVEPSKDNYSGFYYTGAQWEVTGKTKGIARLGYQVKNFDNDQRETFGGLSWDIGLEWLPQEQTLFTIKTTQAAISPDQDGDYNLQTRYKLDMKHDWNSYLTTRLGTLYQQDDYTGITRNEDRYALSAGIDYQIKRWVLLQADWRYQDKTSNWQGYNFDQNVWALSARFSL
ncbi:outer membrane beta-barrel protein [Vibrio hyugaensis]|uniref:outer membrane beta-barrel protein n=1 Tax=Vibrio hyugaensis TaxID=1534743 RepID=UPI0005EEDB8F|nr:outer membrane beta-barrel protein [Vibrio hyugaensis]